MPTSTQRFRLVGEDDASRAFLQVAAAAKLLKSNMDDVSQASLGLTKLIGGSSLIPVAAAATAAVTELGTALGAAGGALGVFGVSAGGFVKGMVKSQQSIATTKQSLTGLTKGTTAYHDAVVKLHQKQTAFNRDYGVAAKGFNQMKSAYADFEKQTGPVTKGVLAKGFQLVADVLPKLVPVSNAAGKAVGGLIDDLSKWTEGPAFAHLLHFLETSGPKDITAFGHSIGNVLSGLGGILSNFVGPGDNAAKSLEKLTGSFAKWGHSKGVSDGVKSFLTYISDNGPQISSVFKSLAQAAPKIATALGGIGSVNLTVMSKFLSLVAGLPQKQFTLIADGLFAIAAGSKAIAVVNGLAGAGGAIGSLLKSKGLIGKAGGIAGATGGLGVQKVFVVNMAEGGLGGVGGKGGLAGDVEKGALATAASAAVPIAAAAVAAGALAYIAVKVQGGPAKPASPGYRDHAGGLSPADSRAMDAQRLAAMYPYLAKSIKSVGTAYDSMKAKAADASRAIELSGPAARNAAKGVVSAIQTMSNRGTGLDALKAKGAAASQQLDMIGPHAKSASGIAVQAISGVVSTLAHIHDKSFKITADTSQAMDNLRVMQYQIDQLHGKTVMVRAIGGHTVQGHADGGTVMGPRTPYGDKVLTMLAPGEEVISNRHGEADRYRRARGMAGGGTVGGGGSAFSRQDGYSRGKSFMDGLLAGIKNRQLSVESAISKVAAALGKAKSRVANLQSVRAGFRSTFGADSIFGQDFSHANVATINGEQVDQGGTAPGSIGDVLAFQKAQRDKARQLNADVAKVTKLGLSKALVRQLRAQGASGAATLHALASGTRAQIQQANAYDKQTSSSLASAGMRAGNYVRGGSVSADLRNAKKTEHVLELLEHHLHDLAHSEKKGETIVVNIDSEAFIRAVKRRNSRKGVKSAGL